MTGRDDFAELISAFLDGEVSPEEKASVEERLVDNAEDRRLFEDMRAMRKGLQSLPPRRLGKDLSENILRDAERTMLAPDAAQLRDKTPPAPPPVQRTEDRDAAIVAPAPTPVQSTSWRPLFWFAATIAAVLLIMLLGPWFERRWEVAVGPSDEAPGSAAGDATPRAAESSPRPAAPKGGSGFGSAPGDRTQYVAPPAVSRNGVRAAPELASSTVERTAGNNAAAAAGAGESVDGFNAGADHLAGQVAGGMGGGGGAATDARRGAEQAALRPRPSGPTDTMLREIRGERLAEQLAAEPLPADRLFVVNLDLAQAEASVRSFDECLVRNEIYYEGESANGQLAKLHKSFAGRDKAKREDADRAGSDAGKNGAEQLNQLAAVDAGGFQLVYVEAPLEQVQGLLQDLAQRPKTFQFDEVPVRQRPLSRAPSAESSPAGFGPGGGRADVMPKDTPLAGPEAIDPTHGGTADQSQAVPSRDASEPALPAAPAPAADPAAVPQPGGAATVDRPLDTFAAPLQEEEKELPPWLPADAEAPEMKAPGSPPAEEPPLVAEPQEEQTLEAEMPGEEPADSPPADDAYEEAAPMPAEPEPPAAALDGAGTAGRPQPDAAPGETAEDDGVAAPRRRQAGAGLEGRFSRPSTAKRAENRSDDEQPTRVPADGRKDGKKDGYTYRSEEQKADTLDDEPTAPGPPSAMDLKVAEREERKQKFRERGTRPEKTAQQPKGVARRLSMTRGRELTELAKRKIWTAGAQVHPGRGGEGKWGAGADEDSGAGLSPPAPAVRPPAPAGTFADPSRTAPETPAEPPSPQKLVRVLFVLQNVPPMADIAAEVPAGPPTGAAARAMKGQPEVGAESVEADAVMEAAEAPPDE